MQYDPYHRPPPTYNTDPMYPPYDTDYHARRDLPALSAMPSGSGYADRTLNVEPLQQQPLLVANLPPYELPPEFVPRSERRIHSEYGNDFKKFGNRTVSLHRNKPADQLGFNVRGGAEHKCGIFISKVTPRTDAYKAGLQEGDQILFANGESFLHIDQHEAVKSLKKCVNVELIVKYFPYAYDKSFDRCKSNPTLP